MKARLLLGIAALAAPALFATPAQADGCNNYRRRAAATEDAAELAHLSSLALGDACSREIRNFIDERIRAVGGDPNVQQTSQVATRAAVQALVARPEEELDGRPSTPAPPPVADRPSPTSATPPEERQAAPEVVSEPPARPLPTLVVGQPLPSVRLESGDETFGSLYYDQYTLQLEANQFVEIVMQAQDFSPIVAIGQGRAPDNFYDMADAFPDGETDQDVRLRFLTPESGEYTILAGSVEQYGTYSISVSPFVPPAPPRPTPIALDSTMTGSFTAESPVLYEENGVSYALYSFRARAGEALQLSMTAPDGSGIDSYLVVGRMGENGFEEIDRNDDRGDGTLNSLVRFTPDRDGEYVLRARTFSPGQYGEFQIAAYRTATLTAPRELSSRAGAWAQSGQITIESPVLAGTEETSLPLRYTSYEFRPRAGRRYRVHAYSGDFEPIVDIVRAGAAVDVYQKGASAREPNDAVFQAERGVYTVRVSAQPDQSGAFDLVISEIED